MPLPRPGTTAAAAIGQTPKSSAHSTSPTLLCALTRLELSNAALLLLNMLPRYQPSVAPPTTLRKPALVLTKLMQHPNLGTTIAIAQDLITTLLRTSTSLTLPFA